MDSDTHLDDNGTERCDNDTADDCHHRSFTERSGPVEAVRAGCHHDEDPCRPVVWNLWP